MLWRHQTSMDVCQIKSARWKCLHRMVQISYQIVRNGQVGIIIFSKIDKIRKCPVLSKSTKSRRWKYSSPLHLRKRQISYLLHEFADLSAPLIVVRKRARSGQSRRELSEDRVALAVFQLGNDPLGSREWSDRALQIFLKSVNENVATLQGISCLKIKSNSMKWKHNAYPARPLAVWPQSASWGRRRRCPGLPSRLLHLLIAAVFYHSRLWNHFCH